MDKYIGIDVHARSCTLAVVDGSGKRVGQHVIETNGESLIECLRMIPGQRHLCMEEGTQSAWLYEILSPHV
jgi:predicted NBD/HSP70 family sugar kinase